MSNFGFAGHGFSLKALLEDPSLQTAPNLNSGHGDIKKPGKLGGLTPNINSAFLGPRWDRPNGEDGGEFDLEYMDLDEFLTENGIPVNLEENDDAETISLLASALAKTPPHSPNREPPGVPIGPPSPRLSITEKVKDTSNLGVYLPESPATKQSLSPISLSPAVSPRTPEPSAIERYLLDDSFGVTIDHLETGSNKQKGKKGKTLEIEISEAQVATIPVFMQQDSTVRVSEYSTHASAQSQMWKGSETEQNSCADSNDSVVLHNSIPGAENFDPKSRKFSEEELKPQPIIKKSKKIFVDESSKDDRYWQRRKKNNIAAKRSRDARRVKENQIAMRAAFLESENDDLREEVERYRRENEELIKRLSKYEKV